MRKRKALLLVNILVASISLAGCDFKAKPKNPNEPGVQEYIPFTSATISPDVLKVKAGETLTLSVTTAPANATESGLRFESEKQDIATISESGVITGVKAGTSKISVFGGQSNKLLGSRILTVIPGEEPVVHIDVTNTLEKTKMGATYNDYVKNNAYGSMDYCPTTGNPKLLVIPIWFSDSDTFIAEENKEVIRGDIEKAYFGTNEEVGWRSVKTYYEEESGGLLTLDGVVSSWYEITSSYTSYATNTNSTVQLVKTAVNWFFSQPDNSSYSRTDFDSDGNGYLDGVMLIYAAPDYGSLQEDDWNNLWAYCYWTATYHDTFSPNPNVFFWASYDFMYSPGDYATSRTGLTEYGRGDTSHVPIDTHAFIHEMGHVFGLDDYYDYSGQYVPAGGFSMQDYNIGGHDPYSIMAYGWARPYIVTNTSTVTIETFQKSKDLILLSPGWNSTNSPFDEYILLELYSPTGLNQFDCENKYDRYFQGPDVVGIRMWHVDARLLGYDSSYQEFFTTDINDSDATYGVLTAFNNTYFADDPEIAARITPLGKDFADYNLLQLIRNNVNETYRPTSCITKNNLFRTGTYNLKEYLTQFVKGDDLQFNNGQSLDWTIEITIGESDNDSAAIVKLTKNR